MDEEELEQPSSKINLGSFFERVDSVEKVANNALSRANANLGIISNQKLIINSLNVTIEAMETKIRDIANYIIIEKKLEKDVEKDRALEEQDRLQKQAMVDRATTIMGEPGPQGEPGQPAEQQQGGGSSLLGSLLRLGIGAFTLKFIWPAILPLAGGLLKGALAKFAAFSIGGLGTLLKGIVVSTLGGLGIFGLGKLFTNLGNSIKDRFDKVAEGSKNIINNFKFGKDGSVDGPDKVEGGEGGTEVEKENLVNGDESMRDTLSEKDLMVTPGTRIDEYGAEGGGEPSSGDLSMFDDEVKTEGKEIKDDKKKFEVIEGEQDITIEQLEREIVAHETKIEKMKEEGKNERFIEFEIDKMELKKEVLKRKQLGMGDYEAKRKYKIVEPIKNGKEELDLSSDNVDGDMTQAIAKTNERIDNLIGGENVEQNNGNLVSANKPNVSEATLKVAAAPLPFVKVIKNNQLSTSPKSYNGLPPEIAAMIS